MGERRNRRARRLARAAAGAAAGALAGTAIAGAHGGDPTWIHACREAGDGTVHIVGPDDSCAPGTGLEPVDWNIAGAAGPPGAAGPVGPAGDAGPIGRPGPDGPPSDLALRIVVERSGRPSLAYVRKLTAQCRSNEHVVSGGYRVLTAKEEHDDMLFPAALYASRPASDGGGWTAELGNVTAHIAVPWALEVFAWCAQQGGAR